MANTNDARGEAPHTDRRRKKRRSPVSGFFLTLGKVLGTLVLIGALTGTLLASFAAVYIKTYIVPRADVDVADFSLDLSSKMYYFDKSGTRQELRTLYGGANRVWVTYDKLPKYLIEATIAIEDKRFFKHKGVDWSRTAKGVLDMLTGSNVQGGSTITQQLIKNLTSDDEVTVQRKILEIFRALEFEKKYEKEVILEWYLNYIFLGSRSDGVYTAAYTYFGKDVSQLSLAECASLISITNNPSIYGPYVIGRGEDGQLDYAWGRKNNAKRAALVLKEMLKQERISQEEHDQAAAQIEAGLDFVYGEGEKHEESVYSWYEDQVINDVIADLMATKNYSEKLAINMVYHGGLQIDTCLDPEVQAVVDGVYQDMNNLPYTSGSGQQLQSGITVLDAESNVVAISGGMGEKEGSRILSYAATRRAPGSSFKPVSVYAPALDLGLITPAAAMDDIPYRVNNGKAWPSNSYDSYKGRMAVREGLYRSSNPLAVRTLERLTPRASFDFLTNKLGFDLVEREEIRGEIKSDIDLSPLAMGGLTNGVSTIEMAGAFSIFPRGGTYLTPRTYSRVYDDDGNIILDNTTDRTPEQVIKSTTAWYMNDMLKDVVNPNLRSSGATGYDAYFPNMSIAGKTGSTNSNHDRWFVGYTPYYTAAVWTGYAQPERIRATGNPAAQLWSKVMQPLHEVLENKDFARPDGAGEPVKVAVCADSGLRALEDTCGYDPRGSRIRYEYFFPGDEPSEYCTAHSAPVEVCIDSPMTDASGAAIPGLYHLVREFCPEEQRISLSFLDVERDSAAGAFAQDRIYTRAYIEELGDAAYCPIHTEAPAPEVYDPSQFNILVPSTWPTEEQWPGFDPINPSTWPDVNTPPGGIPTEPGEPSVEPTPPPTSPSPGGGPDENEPAIPAA